MNCRKGARGKTLLIVRCHLQYVDLLADVYRGIKGKFREEKHSPQAMDIISMQSLEKKIIKDFGITKFVVCTDAGLASNDNRQFNTQGERSYIVTQSLKKIKKHIKDWALNPEGWTKGDSTGLDISSVMKAVDDGESYELTEYYVLYVSSYNEDEKKIELFPTEEKIPTNYEDYDRYKYIKTSPDTYIVAMLGE